jgi:DNA polymerase-3 subunit delta'
MTERPLGNDKLLDRLRTLVESDRLHPCLLFEGPVGVGKAMATNWLACLANCEAPNAPCGECWSCRQIPLGQHPDVIHVGVDPKKTARIISVAQARELQRQLMVKPFHARRRFVIIDPADAMTPEAANALLKTFEDPPSQTHFVLITGAPASLLITVRSRSQRIRFAPVSKDALVPWLEQRGIQKASLVAQAAEGCPGRALTMDLSGVDEWRVARDALLAALDGDVATQLKYAETLARGDRSKWAPKVDLMMDALGSVLRDALSVSHGGEVLYNRDRQATVDAWARALGPSGVAAATVFVGDARERLERFVNGRLVLDALIAKLSARLRAGERHAAV